MKESGNIVLFEIDPFTQYTYIECAELNSAFSLKTTL